MTQGYFFFREPTFFHSKKFLDFYEENISVHTTLFPFVKETLEQFKQSGIKLGVCTNKMQHFTDKILRDLEIESYFTFVQGATEQGIKKPDPKFLEMLLDKMQVAQESAVMVGDSLNDIVIAKGNNVRCVAVSFGYTKVAPKDLGADAVIDSFKDLPEALKNIFTRIKIFLNKIERKIFSKESTQA